MSDLLELLPAYVLAGFFIFLFLSFVAMLVMGVITALLRLLAVLIHVFIWFKSGYIRLLLKYCSTK
jgi:hypothetical protein